MENMFRLLKADEIECKISNTKSISTSGIQLLLYKTARTDMDILDEVIGPMFWDCEYREIKGNMYCGIGIRKDNEKIVKWDCGVESAFGDKEKGEASDSFKRAGTKWGIGRELYTSPFIWINLKDYTLAKDSKTTYDDFEVVHIAYDNNRRISELKIKNTKLNRIVFDMKAPNIIPENSGENKKEEIKTPTNVLENVLQSGKHKGKKWIEICQEDMPYVDFLITKENAVATKVKKEYTMRFPDAPKFIELPNNEPDGWGLYQHGYDED